MLLWATSPHPKERGPLFPEEITRAINSAFEVAVRRDPGNGFWMHNRWKAHR